MSAAFRFFALDEADSDDLSAPDGFAVSAVSFFFSDLCFLPAEADDSEDLVVAGAEAFFAAGTDESEDLETTGVEEGPLSFSGNLRFLARTSAASEGSGVGTEAEGVLEET